MPIEERNIIIKPQEVFKALEDGYDVLMIDKNFKCSGYLVRCYNLRDLPYREVDEYVRNDSNNIDLTTEKIFIRTRRENKSNEN